MPDNSQAMTARKGLSQEFRKMLPQPRSLPFTPPQRKRKSDAPSELTRSTAALESEAAAEESPAKLPESRTALKRISVAIDNETLPCRSPAPASEPTPLVQSLPRDTKPFPTENEVASPAKKKKTAIQKQGKKSEDKPRDNTQSKPITPPNDAVSNRTKKHDTTMAGNTTETPIQQGINSTTGQQTQSSANAVATEEHADPLASPRVIFPRKCKKARETAPTSAPVKSLAVTSKGHADRLPSPRARPTHVRPPQVRPSRRRASPRRKNIPKEATKLTTVDAGSQTHWDTTVTIPLPRHCSSKQNSSREPHILELPMVITESMLRQVNEATSSIFDKYEIDMQRSSDAGLCAQLYLDRIMTARRDFWSEKLSEYGSCFSLV
ncbi:hypothetical protein ACRE_016440 [Hapsidospora chrysogenum ATCC 11550]|uniref:Uncharacterized protein n=1 Tax=Hapsidospora chrysogenum (strain ATCC 11550 / CBS 779.69 / DSM 880 / IAM 14645 / JCM 23072 / IMI 49137) TaxID=857340 RepID=A0A086TDN9_HAPC1|nr:hypothetical protein ACRE_016440 [Hapsidospora chrysogenum ATCC 11550]